jgi:hypothetical protein
MAKWKPLDDEDEILDGPTQVETSTLTNTLDDDDLAELLNDKIGDEIEPPGIDQAIAKFRQMSGPDVSIYDALKYTYKFCKRFEATKSKSKSK